MQLTYRGIPYETNLTAAPAMETLGMGTFLGQQYPMKQPQVARHQSPAELTYRGVRYSW